MRIFILFLSMVSLVAVRSGWVETDEPSLHSTSFVSLEIRHFE